MLDEFPALGRLDFFESALAFMAGYGLKSFLIAQIAEPDREGLWPEQLDPRQLPCARELRDQRRADRQARVRRARHRHRNARDEELCRPSPEPVARPSDGVAPGDRATAADARRGDATPARRRVGAGLRLSSDPRQEGALLRGPAIAGAHPAAAQAVPRRRTPPATPPQRARRTATIGRGRSSRRRRCKPKTPTTPASAASPNSPSTRRSFPNPASQRRNSNWRKTNADDDAQRLRVLQRPGPHHRPASLARSGRRHGAVTHAHQAHLPPAARSRRQAGRLRGAQTRAPGAGGGDGARLASVARRRRPAWRPRSRGGSIA